MDILHKFEQWGDTHHPKWLDLIRIVLGAFLFYKGVDFLNNSSAITGPLSTKTSWGNFAIIMLSHYVVFAHLLGGVMLMLGFFTRFACILQIPILIGAVFFISFASDVLKPYNELFISILVLLLLCYFLVVGNGPWAINLKDNEKKHV